MPFADTDSVIEEQIGCSIREFFELEGEAKFRVRESNVLRQLIADCPGVIATGGGTVLYEANRQLLRDKTVCVYLRSTPEELFRRLRHDSKRPLLQVADPAERLREMYAQRHPLYEQASQFVIDIGRPTVAALVNMILMQLELAGLVDAASVPSAIELPPA